MTEWIKVTSETAGTTTYSGSIETNITPSPYDVPIAVRGSLPKKNSLLIEFKYLDRDEPTMRVQKSHNVDLLLGIHSRRLMGIEILLQHGVSKPELVGSIRSAAVSNALRRIRIDSPNENTKNNYDLAQKIVTSRGTDIAQELTRAL
jgi:hypothetical protein